MLGAGELDTIVRHVSARTAGLGPLESLLGDPSITEVMVNASAGVWIERDGTLSRTGLVLDDGDRRPPDRAGGGAARACESIDPARSSTPGSPTGHE